MADFINLEKLTELKDKGVINEEEFEEQKRVIFAKAMRETGEHENPKNGIIYIVLAWFLGTIGIHNFYAGYVLRGSIQLLLTVLSPMFLFVPLMFTALWALAELLWQNKSKGGRRFGGNRKLIFVLRLAAIVVFVLAFYSASLVDVDSYSGLVSEEDFMLDDISFEK